MELNIRETNIMPNQAKITELLRSTGRDGIDELIEAMDEGGFFLAPCSGKYHLCEVGGLAEHTLNVCRVACSLAAEWTESMPDCRPEEWMASVTLCAILHDLGKMGDHGKQNYVPNYVRSKTKNKETGEYDTVRSTAEPFKTNSDLLYEEHEIRSVIIAERYIYLSEEEEGAILHHNGLFGKLDSSYGTHGFDRNLLAFIIHTADMYCSRFVEK